MLPGTYTLSPNGTGLGQGKTFFRSFPNGSYTMTFDGVPFQDTNSVSQHSWANFPAQWIGGVDFDRSPGTASTVGPANFGGSINLQSKEVPTTQDVRVTESYGTWSTNLLQLDYDTGLFGPGDKSSLTLGVHQMKSDGYQTYNYQKRDGGDGKYLFRFSPHTYISVVGGMVDIWNNTPKHDESYPATGAALRRQFPDDQARRLPDGGLALGGNWVFRWAPTIPSITAWRPITFKPTLKT